MAEMRSIEIRESFLTTRLAERGQEVERLKAKIDAALQRLNESGTGEVGLTDTIHAVHAILRG